MRNAFSIDVEEHFQVSALAGKVSKVRWDTYESRVVANTLRCLDLLEAHGVQGTFFVLGWVAQRYPQLVRRIVAGGHEIASHGMEHDRIHDLDSARFSNDVKTCRLLLEDLSGGAVRGYRAPSFSLRPGMDWAYYQLVEAGYHYSSSVYPVRHDHYGAPDAPRQAYRPLADAALVEIPMTTALVAGRALPASGGGYFRLLPYIVSKRLLSWAGQKETRSCMFYMHPWEVDPDQPRVAGLPLKSRFRHYVNLHRTEARLRELLKDFAWGRIDRVFAAELSPSADLPTLAALRH